MNPLEAIGREAADAQPPPSADALARQRARLLLTVQSPTRSPRLTPRRAAVGVAALAAAAGLALALGRGSAKPSPLSARALGRTIETGEWLAAGSDPVTLRFSDGSEIVLAPGTSARIERADAHGAQVLVERGRAEVRVTHRPRTSWRFAAGPYTVSVTGTAFSIGWEPSSTSFDLTMREGRVVLRGPRCDEGIALGSRDRVRADVRAQTLNLSPPEVTASRASISALPTPQEPIPALPTPQEPIPALPTPQEPIPARPRSSGAGAHARAPADNVAAPADDAAAAALRASDIARLSGQHMRARELLLDLRLRFAHTPEAARAAFLLGTLSLDTFAAPATGARWFEVYLREAPDGSLAREALGRRVQALQSAGETVGARAAALRYLSLDPEGPFAHFARSVVATQESQ